MKHPKRACVHNEEFGCQRLWCWKKCRSAFWGFILGLQAMCQNLMQIDKSFNETQSNKNQWVHFCFCLFSAGVSLSTAEKPILIAAHSLLFMTGKQKCNKPWEKVKRKLNLWKQSEMCFQALKVKTNDVPPPQCNQEQQFILFWKTKETKWTHWTWAHEMWYFNITHRNWNDSFQILRDLRLLSSKERMPPVETFANFAVRFFSTNLFFWRLRVVSSVPLRKYSKTCMYSTYNNHIRILHVYYCRSILYEQETADLAMAKYVARGGKVFQRVNLKVQLGKLGT